MINHNWHRCSDEKKVFLAILMDRLTLDLLTPYHQPHPAPCCCYISRSQSHLQYVDCGSTSAVFGSNARMQLQEAVSVLDAMLEDIHQLHIHRTSSTSKADFHGRWTGDEEFRSNLQNLKRCAERVSHTCTKFTLVVLHQSDATAVSTIMEEFIPYLKKFFDFFR